MESPPPPSLDDQAFAAALAAFDPFEPQPHLAVGLSGGPDSWALTLLLDRWARARGGRVTGLIVDHRMRPDSPAEAERVAASARARGIAAVILPWLPPWPAKRDLAAARAARYRLLSDWCRAEAVLHLAIAHHRDDQAETVALRAAKGSGPRGMAGMGACVPLPQGRLLRPLLAWAKSDLQAVCARFEIETIDDPSNRNPRWLRAALRAGLSAAQRTDWLAQGGDAAVARAAQGQRVAALLAAAAALHPFGFVRLNRARLLADPLDGRQALAAVLTLVGGAAFPPGAAALADLYAELGTAHPRPRTLLGCRVAVGQGQVLVTREALGPRCPLVPGTRVLWDRRFEISAAAELPSCIEIAPLGGEQAARLVEAGLNFRDFGIPQAALVGLPALFDLDGLLALPHLNHCRSDAKTATMGQVSVRAAPARPLLGRFLYIPEPAQDT